MSAAFFGAALLAQAVEIWTDTNGVLTADPRLVENTRSIAHLTFEQGGTQNAILMTLAAGELAHFGAKVLHPSTIQPAMEVGIPVCVRNSYNKGHPGTFFWGGL